VCRYTNANLVDRAGIEPATGGYLSYSLTPRVTPTSGPKLDTALKLLLSGRPTPTRTEDAAPQMQNVTTTL
jgi:hypothetical protein